MESSGGKMKHIIKNSSKNQFKVEKEQTKIKNNKSLQENKGDDVNQDTLQALEKPANDLRIEREDL